MRGSCSAKHHGGTNWNTVGQLRPPDMGLDEQRLGAAALGEREREVDRGGGLAVAVLRARHDHDLRPADLEQVVAQDAERGAAVGVRIDQQCEPRIDVVLGRWCWVRSICGGAPDGLACGLIIHRRLAMDQRDGSSLPWPTAASSLAPRITAGRASRSAPRRR